MNPPDGHEGDGGTAARALAIELDELCWAPNSRLPLGQSSQWLDLESSALLTVAEPDLPDEVAEAAEDPRDGERWLRIAAIESSDAFRTVEDFVDQCGEPRLARALGQALQQRKPLRRFKDTLADQTAQRDAWFVFERQAMEATARRRCEDQGITSTWVTHRQPPTS